MVIVITVDKNKDHILCEWGSNCNWFISNSLPYKHTAHFMQHATYSWSYYNDCVVALFKERNTLINNCNNKLFNWFGVFQLINQTKYNLARLLTSGLGERSSLLKRRTHEKKPFILRKQKNRRDHLRHLRLFVQPRYYQLEYYFSLQLLP